VFSTPDYNPFMNDRFYLDQVIKGEAPSASNHYVVARNRNKTHALIGASGDSSVVKQGGIAFVFRATRAGWECEATLIPEHLQAYSGFGHSVALDKKGKTAVIGAYMDSTFHTNAGAVYLFQQRDLRWYQHKKLFPPVEGGFQFFGNRVFIDDDGAFVLVETQTTSPSYAIHPQFYVFKKHFQHWNLIDQSDEHDSRYHALLQSYRAAGVSVDA
jgi:hypothetical protein